MMRPGNQDQSTGSGLAVRDLLGALLLYKVFLILFVFLSMRLLPNMFSSVNYFANFHAQKSFKTNLLTRVATWDGQHYIHLSEKGYRAGEMSIAMYPLWPMMMRFAAKFIPGNFPHHKAGLLLSNLFSLIGFLLFYRLARDEIGAEAAGKALLLLLAFPGALFYSFIYSESLFFLLSMIFFLGLRGSKLWMPALASFLMPLTRAIGIFAAVPFFIHCLERKKSWRVLLLSFIPLLGWGCYLIFMNQAADDPLAGIKMQSHFVSNSGFTKILYLPDFFKSLFVPFRVSHDFLGSIFDRIWFFWLLAALFSIWKLGRHYFAYALLAGIIPAMTQSFMSYTRYFAVLFPVFLVTAKGFEAPGRNAWFWLLTAVLFALQILFLLRYCNFHWAG